MQTELIRYNLAERGRTFSGKERNFDIPRVAAEINGPKAQERVKHRDMFGYYGHWPRIAFGMNPAEGGMVDGKVVKVEPALVTVHLQAFDDGTIEHQAEFLDNEAGNVAWKLYKNKTGGFSSAISEHRITGRPVFYGFDYVLEPNYSTNRGYELVLDSVGTLDSVDAFNEYQGHVTGMAHLLDCVMSDRNAMEEAYRNALEALAGTHKSMRTLEVENEQLASMLTLGKNVLDSVGGVTMPMLVPREKFSSLKRDIDGFRTADLARVDIPEPEQSRSMVRVLDHVLGR